MQAIKNKLKSRYHCQIRFTEGSQNGSLTVETAIVLPFFIIALMAVCSFFSLQLLEMKLKAAMEYAAGRASAYYYALENVEAALSEGGEDREDIAYLVAQGAITGAYLKQKVIAEVGEDYLEKTWLVSGSDSLGILGSILPDSHGNIDFVMNYQVKIPFLPGKIGKMTFSLKVCRRAWSGNSTIDEDQDEEQEQMVYITETGSVYHLSLSCSYLKLSIKLVTRSEADALRSSDGSKYYACERCEPAGDSQLVYLTEDGNRYHSDINCSSLKRGIRTVALSEVSEMKACSRCGGKE